MKDQIKERYNRVKSHLRTHKSTYITGASCFALGALAMAAATRNGDIHITESKIESPWCWKPRNTINKTVIEFAELSTPSKPIFDKTTNTGYGSIGEFSRQTGVDRSLVYRHLKGDLPTAKGHVLEAIDVA